MGFAGLEVEGLVKRFGGVPAVSGLYFSVAPGEVYGLLGPDGAGKTTALRCLAGVLRADAGTVRVAGFDLRRSLERARANLGYMPQGQAIYGDLTVEENLSFFAALYGVGPEWAERRRSLLEFSRLEEFRHRLAAHLSGGMRQKLALCCALVHSPPVLLLDEPTTGVDAVSRREFWQLIGRLREAGSAVLATTAYLEEAERCSRVGFLLGGRLVEEGEPSRLQGSLWGRLVRVRTGPGQLLSAADHLRRQRPDWTVRLGADALVVLLPAGAGGAAAVEAVAAELRRAGLSVADAGLSAPRLEDALAARLRTGGGGDGGR
ncbi:MAG: ABC transporter ATP-binding protein [Acetobacteraceae bacterium]|nr:ABC transporter ATP-binding protein [Acetobacteraceae bacterium]